LPDSRKIDTYSHNKTKPKKKMIIRIVRMTFQEDKVDDFLEIFNTSKNKIRHFEGCHHLEFLKDANQPNVFMTYSYWESEKHLNQYRDSELFQKTWAPQRRCSRKSLLLFLQKEWKSLSDLRLSE
jgi:quinol monooxygenase YgiN